MNAIRMDLTEGQIQNAVAVALAEAFSPAQREALIRDIVRAHLSQKANSYDKETLLSKAVGSLIREIAEKAMREKVEEMAPRIREIVRGALGERFEQQVLDQLRYAIGRLAIANLSITASATFEDRD